VTNRLRRGRRTQNVDLQETPFASTFPMCSLSW
jgi:hypothetical protein